MPGKDLTTAQLPYRLLRDIVSSSEGDLAAGTKTWATFVSTYHPTSGTSAIAVRIDPKENRLAIIFDCKNADSDTFAFSVYLYAEGGPAEFICSVTTSTAGAQQSDFTGTTRYFCDTLGTITQRFLGGSGAIEKVDAAGGNGVAKLHITDLKGYKYILILFTTISGTDDVRAWMRGY